MTNSEMKVSLLTTEDWKEVIEGQKALKKQLNEIAEMLQNGQPNTAVEWLTLEEAREMINVCPKTMQKYRDNGIIPFSQFGRKIYFNKKDIVAFLESKRVHGK